MKQNKKISFLSPVMTLLCTCFIFGSSGLFNIHATSVETILPFQEVSEQSEFAQYYQDSMYTDKEGVTIFDANNDGLLDIYLIRKGRTLGLQTDSKGILSDQKLLAAPSTLFLNQGANDKNVPIFLPFQNAAKNQEHYQAEMLIENKYQPRKNSKTSEFNAGRIGFGAIPADFNGDGLLDLYLLNGHYGTLATVEGFGILTYPPFLNAKNLKPITLYAPPFMAADQKYGANVLLNIDGVQEREGQNTLYLNLGDQDQDGVPEWKDVTKTAGVGGHWGSWGVLSPILTEMETWISMLPTIWILNLMGQVPVLLEENAINSISTNWQRQGHSFLKKCRQKWASQGV